MSVFAKRLSLRLNNVQISECAVVYIYLQCVLSLSLVIFETLSLKIIHACNATEFSHQCICFVSIHGENLAFYQNQYLDYNSKKLLESRVIDIFGPSTETSRSPLSRQDIAMFLFSISSHQLPHQYPESTPTNTFTHRVLFGSLVNLPKVHDHPCLRIVYCCYQSNLLSRIFFRWQI